MIEMLEWEHIVILVLLAIILVQFITTRKMIPLEDLRTFLNTAIFPMLEEFSKKTPSTIDDTFVSGAKKVVNAIEGEPIEVETTVTIEQK